MRKLQLLIDQARRATENEEFSDSVGIADSEFIQYANDAQDRIQSLLAHVSPDMFLTESTISTISGQEAYSLPFDLFHSSRVKFVEYSDNGLGTDYHQLKQGHFVERVSGVEASNPSFYIRKGNQILLQPQPSKTGALVRVVYEKKLPRIDVVGGTVSAVTLGSSSITALTLDTTAVINDTEILDVNALTVVDRDGHQKMRQIPVDAIDTATGVVTVTSGFTFDTGETIAVGNFVVPGPNSSTHANDLPEICERYIIAYMIFKILKRDSSNDSVEQAQEILSMEQEIVQTFSDPDSDVDYVPILDAQYIAPDDGFYY